MNTKLTHYSDFSVVSNIQSTGLVSLYLITSLEHTRSLFPWILAPKTGTTTIILFASYISRGKKLGQHFILTFLNTRKIRPSVYIFNSWLKQEGDCDPELINLIIEAGKRYEHENI
jgi:hypothetical protein